MNCLFYRPTGNMHIRWSKLFLKKWKSYFKVLICENMIKIATWYTPNF